MIKLLLSILLVFSGAASIWAAPSDSNGDQDFINKLQNVKSLFEDGYPKEVVKPIPKVVNVPVVRSFPKPITMPVIRPRKIQEVQVVLPNLQLQGVVVGEELHKAIINDEVVPLQGTIQGARLESVTKDGVGMFFQGKRFFLKVE